MVDSIISLYIWRHLA